MRKRILCMLLCIVMCLSLVPTVAFAAATEYDIWVNGEQFTRDKLTIKCGDGTASYDPAANTLTLNGAQITKACENGAISAKDALTVNVIGDSSITLDDYAVADGIYSNGDITLTGTNDLDILVIRSGHHGVFSNNGNVTVNMEGDLTVDSTEDGIRAGKIVEVSGSGNVTVKTKYACLFGRDTVTVSGSGDLTCTGDYGIQAVNGVTISGSGDIQFNSSYVGIFTGNDVVFSGSGDVSVHGRYLGIKIDGTDSKVLLNGTNSSITLTSAESKAVRNSTTNTSPVAGTNFAAYVCVAGAPETASVVYRLAHSFTNYVSNGNATCTVDGTKTAKCDNCEATDTQPDVGSAKGHSFTNYISDGNATCTADGTKTATCANGCGETDAVADAGTAKGHTYGEWTTTKEPTLTEKGMKERICSVCDAKETEEIPVLTPTTYSIISGANGEWTKGSTTGLAFTSDAPFDKFDSVQVDGSTIAAANYTAEEGSTKITLAPAYLETLGVGSHSIKIVSNDGSASTNFTVKKRQHPLIRLIRRILPILRISLIRLIRLIRRIRPLLRPAITAICSCGSHFCL